MNFFLFKKQDFILHLGLNKYDHIGGNRKYEHSYIYFFYVFFFLIQFYVPFKIISDHIRRANQ